MCINHRFNRIMAGFLICTVCGAIVYKAIEDKKPQPHIPERNFNNITNPYPRNFATSGTASTVTTPFTFTLLE